MERVIVIGGGLAGLASAVALAEAGLRVTLYERRPVLGGRAASFFHPSGQALVDNCQHVLLRCCTNLIDFYQKSGVDHGIAFRDRLFFIDEAGRLSVIRASRLPAPLHLMPSFLAFKGLSLLDKLSIGYGMLSMMAVYNRFSPHSALYTPHSMLDWLRAHRQTRRAIEAFWRTILVSALNDELEDIAAGYGIVTIVKGFLKNRRGYEIGLPTVPLRDLYEPCAAFLKARGGAVELDRPVAAMSVRDGKIDRLTLSDGTDVAADAYVSAVPFDALLRLLPEDTVAGSPYFSGLSRFEVSPITAVHVWFDRPVMRQDYVAVLGRTVQWVFNQTMRGGTPALPDASGASGVYLGLVISAADGLMGMPQQEIVERAMQDMTALFPRVREARLLKAIVVKEGRATFAPKPGCDRWRPGPRSPVSNLFVAGDWTQTGWPATMEGAVRSGYRCAEALLEDAGAPRRILQPDLPADGLMRWIIKA